MSIIFVNGSYSRLTTYETKPNIHELSNISKVYRITEFHYLSLCYKLYDLFLNKVKNLSGNKF